MVMFDMNKFHFFIPDEDDWPQEKYANPEDEYPAVMQEWRAATDNNKAPNYISTGILNRYVSLFLGVYVVLTFSQKNRI